VNPAVFAAMPFVFLWLAWKRSELWKIVRWEMAAALVFLAACLPWTLRNYEMFHQFVPFRSNFGYELWLGNNSRVPNSWMGSAALIDALYNSAELQRYEQLGETAYVREKKDGAMQYIRSHRGEQPLDAALRAATFWCGTWYMSVDPSWKLTDWKFRIVLISDSLLPLLALLGLWIAWRDEREFVALLCAFLLFFPLVYYITHAHVGYRYPIDPILILLAALFVYPIWAKLIWSRMRIANG